MKATYKGKATNRYDKRYTTLFYEYKGFEYCVVAPNSWTACSSDFLPNGSESLKAQHQREQKRIDDMLANPELEVDVVHPKGTWDEEWERICKTLEEYGLWH